MEWGGKGGRKGGKEERKKSQNLITLPVGRQSGDKGQSIFNLNFQYTKSITSARILCLELETLLWNVMDTGGGKQV